MTARLDPVPVVVLLGLAGLALVGPGAVLPAVVALQVLALVAWTVLTDAPNPLATVVVGSAAAIGTDAWAVTREGHGVSAGASFVALAFVAAVVAELARRDRARVAESLAVTVAGTLLGVLAATVLALVATRDGTAVAPRLLLAAAAAVALAQVARTVASPQAVRDLAAVAAGLATGGLVGSGPLSPRSGALLGLAVGVAVAVAQRCVDLARAEAPSRVARRALRPLAAAVPLCVAAPVAYVASRLLLA